MKTENPEPKLTQTVCDILDVIQGTDLTVHDVIAIMGNVCSNVIMGIGGHNPEKSGVACARIAHTMMTNVEQIITQELGEEAALEFGASRFAESLECLMRNHGKAQMIELPDRKPKEK